MIILLMLELGVFIIGFPSSFFGEQFRVRPLGGQATGVVRDILTMAFRYPLRSRMVS